MKTVNAIFVVLLFGHISADIIVQQDHYEISTVSEMDAFYDNAIHPRCTLSTNTQSNRCPNWSLVECIGLCSGDDLCAYISLVNNICYTCTFPIGSLWYSTNTRITLDGSTRVYTRSPPVFKYPNTDCDIHVDEYRDVGTEYTDATVAEGKRLTGIDTCVYSGPGSGYQPYYDHVPQGYRGCDEAETPVNINELRLEDNETILGIDIWTIGYSRGMTYHTNTRTTQHFSQYIGSYQEIRGYNLEYMFGQKDASVYKLSFHFSRC